MKLPDYVRLTSIFLALTVLCIPTAWAQEADKAPLAELKGEASLQESLEWLSQAIFSYAAFAVNDESSGLSFFKGFRTVKAEGCTLTLKNEGRYTQTQEPYSYDAVLPMADLKASSRKLFQYVTDFPNINKAYGTWNLRLSTESKRETMYMNSNNSKLGDFRGHLVTFKFQDKEDAKRFEKGLKRVIKLCNSV